MKKSLLILLSSAIISCDTPDSAVKDNRPTDELKLVKLIHAADSTLDTETNEIRKEEFFKLQASNLNKLVKDTLKYKFTDWPVRVEEIDNNPSGYTGSGFVSLENAVNMKFLVQPFDGWDEEYAEVTSPTMECFFLKNDTTLLNMAKKLNKGDEVLITGTFEKKPIELNTEDIARQNFDIKITSIKPSK
jgi:hypothetical protein